MILKPQDVLVLLKLVTIQNNDWSFNKLAVELGMSPAEVHAGVKRALAAKLAVEIGGKVRPGIRNLEEFIVHGLQYVFVPDRGGVCRGIPTAHAAPVLQSTFVIGHELPPVWPDPDGEIRGESFSPLYKSVPIAAKNDQKLYAFLALVDAIRGGRVREREIAIKALKTHFEIYESSAKP